MFTIQQQPGDDRINTANTVSNKSIHKSPPENGNYTADPVNASYTADMASNNNNHQQHTHFKNNNPISQESKKPAAGAKNSTGVSYIIQPSDNCWKSNWEQHLSSSAPASTIKLNPDSLSSTSLATAAIPAAAFPLDDTTAANSAASTTAATPADANTAATSANDRIKCTKLISMLSPSSSVEAGTAQTSAICRKLALSIQGYDQLPHEKNCLLSKELQQDQTDEEVPMMNDHVMLIQQEEKKGGKKKSKIAKRFFKFVGWLIDADSVSSSHNTKNSAKNPDNNQTLRLDDQNKIIMPGMFDKDLILQKYMLNNVYKPGQPPLVNLSPDYIPPPSESEQKEKKREAKLRDALERASRPHAIFLKLKSCARKRWRAFIKQLFTVDEKSRMMRVALLQDEDYLAMLKLYEIL